MLECDSLREIAHVRQSELSALREFANIERESFTLAEAINNGMTHNMSVCVAKVERSEDSVGQAAYEV